MFLRIIYRVNICLTVIIVIIHIFMFRFAGSWFSWTRHQLLKMRYCEVKCQVCKSILKFDEIVKRCEMTPDETIFFQTVLSVNKHSQLKIHELQHTYTQ